MTLSGARRRNEICIDGIVDLRSYFIWEEIQNYFNARIKKMGVKNSYFPLFVSEDALRKEKDHVEGFSAEVVHVVPLAEPGVVTCVATGRLGYSRRQERFGESNCYPSYL